VQCQITGGIQAQSGWRGEAGMKLPDDLPDDHTSYWQEMEQHRAGRDAERAALERAYAIERAREKGRDDLAELLEAGTIGAGEAFFRLHARR
jgi:hypothetical protein